MPDEIEVPAAPAGHVLSERAHNHVNRPVAYVENGQLKQRDPLPDEVASRTREAFKALGEKGMWTAAAQPIDDRLEMQGHRPNAQPGDYSFSLPPGTPDGSHTRIAGFLTALEFSPAMGDHIAETLGRFGRELATHPKDEPEILARERRFIDAWASRHNWDLTARTAAIAKMLEGLDSSVSRLAMSHGEVFMRLAMHADVRAKK